MNGPKGTKMRIIPWCVALVLAVAPSKIVADTISADAKAGFELCLMHFAKPKEGREALEAAGWRFQSTEDEYQWLTKNVARSVVALGRNTGRDPQGCFASYDGMTLQDAMSLAVAEARTLNLARVELQDSPVGVVWTGQVNGKAATLNVLKPVKYDRHRGAAILLIAEK